MDNYVFGRNNVFEMLKEGKRSVSKIVLMKNMKENSKIDQILDMGRTTVNLIGNCVATTVVARWENDFDYNKMKKFLAKKEC